MKKMVLKSIVFAVALCGAGTVAAIMAGARMKPKAIVDLNPDALAAAELAEVQEYPFMRISEGVDPKSASVKAFGSKHLGLLMGSLTWVSITAPK